MEKQKYCRYCGKRIPKKGNRVYYCSEWCSRQWHYENQDYLFYTPGVKQEKCVVCGKDLLPTVSLIQELNSIRRKTNVIWKEERKRAAFRS